MENYKNFLNALKEQLDKIDNLGVLEDFLQRMENFGKEGHYSFMAKEIQKRLSEAKIDPELDFYKTDFGDNLKNDIYELIDREIDNKSLLQSWLNKVTEENINIEEYDFIFSSGHLNEMIELLYHPIGEKLATEEDITLIKTVLYFFQENPNNQQNNKIETIFGDLEKAANSALKVHQEHLDEEDYSPSYEVEESWNNLEKAVKEAMEMEVFKNENYRDGYNYLSSVYSNMVGTIPEFSKRSQGEKYFSK